MKKLLTAMVATYDLFFCDIDQGTADQVANKGVHYLRTNVPKDELKEVMEFTMRQHDRAMKRYESDKSACMKVKEAVACIQQLR
ncbi:hypothetical protein [Cupriavidus sp. CP313]